MAYINNLPLQFNIPSLGFNGYKSTIPNTPSFQSNDSYITNPLIDRYGTVADIKYSIQSNPRIKEILDEYKLPYEVNEKAFNELKNGHLQKTRLIAAKMYSSLPPELKSEVNLKQLQEAAMFHDYGKVLIPDKILNKKDKLTDEEWEIMKQHSELGAELLKNKGFDEHTLELIKYHHQNLNHDGYPSVEDYYEYGLDAQILSLADKYEALTSDERAYRKAMSKEEALALIQKESEGMINPAVLEALKYAI